MNLLHLELDELEIESLELASQSAQEDEADLDSVMIGHGILEIGASVPSGGYRPCGVSCCQTA